MRWKTAYLGVGYALCIAFTILALAPLPSEPGVGVVDKIGHWIVFFGLMMWFAGAYEPAAGWRLYALLALFGLSIEVLQAMGGYRSAEWLDLTFNLAGALCAWGVAMLGFFGWGRRLAGRVGLEWEK